jgi:subtilisin family serine protease
MKTCRRWTLLVAVVATGCASAEKRPEREVPLVVHEGYRHRVVVKLTDATQEDEVAAIVATHGLALAPLIAPRDAGKLDALGLLDQVVATQALPEEAGDTALAAARELAALDTVDYVYLEPLAVPPPVDLEPPSGDFLAQQSYRSPDALDVDFAGSVGATGGDVRLADCEYGWNLAHEDLSEVGAVIEPGQTIAPEVFSWEWDDHGTAVIGITSATANTYGVTGLVPDAEVQLFPEDTVEQGYRRPAAIASAIAASRPGDVVLLEMQTPGPGGDYGPAELDPTVWDLVKRATDAGIIVVAAAGNGSQDLDSADYDEYRSRGDSGAIIVGAGSSTSRTRMWFSTYGARVNVHGWGENVVTTGYGDLADYDAVGNQEYTAQFSGTSSASPLVTSAVVVLQSYAKQAFGRVLTPAEIRQILIDTGTPQEPSEATHIGPFPDLRAAIESLGPVPEPEPDPDPDPVSDPDPRLSSDAPRAFAR